MVDAPPLPRPVRQPKLAPAGRLRLLNLPDAIRAMPPDQRRAEVRRLLGRRTIWLQTLCGAWFTAVWDRGEKLPDGFVRCRCCERATPHSGMSIARLRQVCDDCAVDGSALEGMGAAPGRVAAHQRAQDAFGPSPMLVVCLAAFSGGREIRRPR